MYITIEALICGVWGTWPLLYPDQVPEEGPALYFSDKAFSCRLFAACPTQNLEEPRLGEGAQLGEKDGTAENSKPPPVTT